MLWCISILSLKNPYSILPQLSLSSCIKLTVCYRTSWNLNNKELEILSTLQIQKVTFSISRKFSEILCVTTLKECFTKISSFNSYHKARRNINSYSIKCKLSENDAELIRRPLFFLFFPHSLIIHLCEQHWYKTFYSKV